LLAQEVEGLRLVEQQTIVHEVATVSLVGRQPQGSPDSGGLVVDRPVVPIPLWEKDGLMAGHRLIHTAVGDGAVATTELAPVGKIAPTTGEAVNSADASPRKEGMDHRCLAPKACSIRIARDVT
jgi:hypothetical protein